MPALLNPFVRRRAIAIWRERALKAWEQLGRKFLAAWAAELDGRGEPRATLRWQVLMARVHFYIQRCNQALAQMRGGAT